MGAMGKIAPRFSIPDEWAKGQCPVCESTSLQVLHLSNVADQIACLQCGLSFEVEAGVSHPRIRPKKVPPRLGHKSELAANTWLTAQELKALARQAAAASPSRPSVSQVTPPEESSPVQVPLAPRIPASPSTQPVEEVVERAKKLYALGNSPSQIKTILEGSRTAPEAVMAAMGIVAQLDQRKRQSSQRAVWLGMGAVAVLLLALIGGAAVMALFSPSPPTATPQFNVQSTSAPGNGLALPGLPGVLPEGAVETVAAQPTTAVQRGVGPGISKCPVTPRAAAELFGGNADDWSQSQELGGSWVMFATGLAATVKVPANMSAGYFSTDGGLQMLTVLGPATLSNIGFVTISCEQ